MLNLIIFGPPGAGKGTQSESLIKTYDLVHLSTGDMLRSEIKEETDLGMKAQEFMNAGKLVPDKVVIGMIESRLNKNKEAKGFIFDGFPRTVPQAEALDNLLDSYSAPISGVVKLEVTEEELVKRLLERGKTSGRADDQNEELIRSRVTEYNNKTTPVADYYAEQGKVKPVEGIGEISEIFDNIKKAVDEVK